MKTPRLLTELELDGFVMIQCFPRTNTWYMSKTSLIPELSSLPKAWLENGSGSRGGGGGGG